MPLDHAELRAVVEPITNAKGLPNAMYLDGDAAKEEREKVFFANWAGIGYGKDVPNKGDAVPIDFLGMPLLLLRDKAGAVRVFQNTCRHRGMILVEQPTKIKGVIRCPYHAWCYGLDGQLRSTPYVGGPNENDHPAVNKSELGLFEVRSTVWQDVVFVNIDGKAPAFEEYASEMIERYKEFQKPIFHGGPDSSFQLELNSNWKLMVENNCESYHLPWVHPSLNSYSKIEDHYHLTGHKNFSGQGTTVYNPSLDKKGRSFVDFDGMSSPWLSGQAEYPTLYPNVFMGMHRNQVWAIVLLPQAVDRTIERVEIYYAAEEMQGEDWADFRTAAAEEWRAIFVEDRMVVEGMQRGRHGVMFDGGRFSPVMDNPTHDFHRWVAQQLLA